MCQSICRQENTYILQLLFQERNHVLLNYNTLLVEILYDEVMVVAVNVDDDGLDGRIALDEHAWNYQNRHCDGIQLVSIVPLIARGILLAFGDGAVEYRGECALKSADENERFTDLVEGTKCGSHTLQLSHWLGSSSGWRAIRIHKLVHKRRVFRFLLK